VKRIILIDDSKDTYALVKAVLGEKFQLTWSASLTEADISLRSKTFDLILLDVLLPDGDGFNYCAKLQSNDQTSSIPVIFVTGKTGVSNLVTGLALGADDYIEKPFDPLELRARVEVKLQKMDRKRESESVINRGDLRISLESQTVQVVTDAAETKLTFLQERPHHSQFLNRRVLEFCLLQQREILTHPWRLRS